MTDKDSLRKWVAALRSGEFKQATGLLKDFEGKMCCLGVASEIYRRETGKGRWDGNDADPSWFIVTEGNGTSDFLAEEVQNWFGLNTKNPSLDCVVGGEEDCVPASELNDDYDFNFEMIADAIERTYQL